MRDARRGTRSRIIAVLVCVLCIPLTSAVSGQSSSESIQAVELAPTPWGKPVLVSPSSGAKLYHYPRATTLTWNPVVGAISYKVEREYYGGTWVAYPPVTVVAPDGNNASYTFDFVGDQQGRWRVSAFNGSIYSAPASWRTFSYITRAQMATPTLTSPASNQAFYHWPRTTTVAWKMAPAATGYVVEIMYCLFDRVTCWPYAPVAITDPEHAYYTFEFVGSQPGKWRVTTRGGPTYLDSAPSAWRWFSFGI